MPAYHVEESIEIHAAPQQVYDVVADFGTWTKWSPWLCAEPTADVVVTGEAGTVGSRYSWEGEIVGQGEIEHIALRPGQLIEDEIRFVKPFRSKSEVAFRFERSGEHTKVTWSMDGKLPWFLFWMKSSMTSMIGMDYERGLKMLKEWIETGAVAAETNVRGIEDVGPLHVAGVRRKCSMRQIKETMDEAFSEVKKVVDAKGVPTCGDMVSVYHCVDLKAKTFDFTAGYVIPNELDDDTLSTWTLPASKALVVGHLGSYDHLGNSWSAAYQHVRHKRLKLSNVGTFEIYKNDPKETAVAALKTEVYLPLK